MFEGSTGFIAAMPALPNILVKNLFPLLCRELFHTGAKLTERLTRMRIEDVRENLIFRVLVVVN